MSELNNYTPTPVTREEKILSGADIQPRTRMEYFLKMASENGGGNVPTPTAGDVGKVLLVNSEGQLVLDYPPRDTPVPTPNDAGSVITVNEFGAYVLGEGGSSLPPYTGADEGKVLTVSAKDPVMQETVIVPEQTVMFTNGVGRPLNTTEYTGEEAPVLGGDYAGWVYRSELDLHPGTYVYSDPVLGDSKAIILALMSNGSAIGLGSVENNSFHPDSSISDVSVTISATAVMPVVPSTTTYIIPEQTLTASDFELMDQYDDSSEYAAPLTSSFPTSGFNEGDTAVLNVVGDGSYDLLYHSRTSTDLIGIFVNPQTSYAIGVYTDHYDIGMALEGEIPEDFSMTLSLSTSIPEAEPKWEKSDNDSALIVKVDRIISYNLSNSNVIFGLDTSYDKIMRCFNFNSFKPVYFMCPQIIKTDMGIRYDYPTEYAFSVHRLMSNSKFDNSMSYQGALNNGNTYWNLEIIYPDPTDMQILAQYYGGIQPT